MPTATFRQESIATPLGEALVITDPDGQLRAFEWHDHEARLHTLLRRQYPGVALSFLPHPDTSEAHARLGDYFAGELSAIDVLPVATGGTPFQQRVWQALRTIACGSTISYGELAQRIGQPSAVRAVGLANGANPISVVVPCHRVIGSNRTLTGYAGGLARKQWLLTHEQGQADLFTPPGGSR